MRRFSRFQRDLIDGVAVSPFVERGVRDRFARLSVAGEFALHGRFAIAAFAVATAPAAATTTTPTALTVFADNLAVFARRAFALSRLRSFFIAFVIAVLGSNVFSGLVVAGQALGLGRIAVCRVKSTLGARPTAAPATPATAAIVVRGLAGLNGIASFVGDFRFFDQIFFDRLGFVISRARQRRQMGVGRSGATAFQIEVRAGSDDRRHRPERGSRSAFRSRPDRRVSD